MGPVSQAQLLLPRSRHGSRPRSRARRSAGPAHRRREAPIVGAVSTAFRYKGYVVHEATTGGDTDGGAP